MLIRIGLVFLAGAGVCFYIGVKEHRLSSIADAEPQLITCADLAKDGPGSNAHVRISDYILSSSFIWQQRENSAAYTKVYVPAMPVGGAYHQTIQQLYLENPQRENYPEPTNVRVLLKSTKIKTMQDFNDFGLEETIDGLVINDIESLDQEEVDLLKNSYPGFNEQHCRIVEVGRKPAGAGKLSMLYGGGAMCLLFGLGIFGAYARSNR